MEGEGVGSYSLTLDFRFELSIVDVILIDVSLRAEMFVLDEGADLRDSSIFASLDHNPYVGARHGTSQVSHLLHREAELLS